MKAKFLVALALSSLALDTSAHIDLDELTALETSHKARGAVTAPNTDITLKVNVVRNKNFQHQDLVKLNETKRVLLAVLNSSDFRQSVLDHAYQGRPAYSRTTKSNAEVLETILSGREVLNGVVDNEMDLDLEMYTSSKKVIGWTEPKINTIYVNSKYFSDSSWFTTSHAAGNFTHEWLHKLGFKHSKARIKSRPYTVPYAIGKIVTRLAVKYYNGTLK